MYSGTTPVAELSVLIHANIITLNKVIKALNLFDDVPSPDANRSLINSSYC